MNQQLRVRNTMAVPRTVDPQGRAYIPVDGGGTRRRDAVTRVRCGGSVERGTARWFWYKRRILSPHIEPKSLSARGKLAAVQIEEPPVDRCQIVAPDYPADCSDNRRPPSVGRLQRPALIWLLKVPPCHGHGTLWRCPSQTARRAATGEEKMSGKCRRIHGWRKVRGDIK